MSADLALLRSAALEVLPDSRTHRNRFVIKSGTSSRKYTIAQRISTGLWECNCPGWLRHRKCKHLESMGLPTQVPLAQRPRAITSAPSRQRSAEERARARLRFSDAAYEHYDTSSGFGSPEEWVSLAEGFVRGRGRITVRLADPGMTPDLDTLGIGELPSDPNELLRAMRKASRTTHPDAEGGSAEAFDEVRKAFERLLQRYPRKVRDNKAGWGTS